MLGFTIFGEGVGVDSLLLEGLLLSGFISGHNFLTLLSGGRYFREFTVVP